MISYRPDIDGLRAIAVLAVVFYHLGLGPVRGGFVGVDVFFVISGFLITAIIQREIRQGEFSYAGFYQRRVRRLFPALFVVLAATLATGLAVLLPSDLVVLGRTTAATVFFASNVYLWRHSGYFDGAAELNPLLHTWSLAVEEQFYIGLPVLLLVVNRYARRLVGPAVITVGLGSFVLCVALQPYRPTAVFYLAPFRAWELMAGAVLALGLVPQLAQRWHRETLSAAGLGLLVYSIVATRAGPSFPGWAAALPVLGTAALIHAGTGDSVVRRALSWRPVVYVGLLSYSLYLWHWPLLVYARYLKGLEPLGGWRWAILAASLGLSALSLRFVETPFRRGRRLREPRRLFARAALATGVATALGLGLSWSGGWTARFDPAVIALDRERRPEIPFLTCMRLRLDPARADDVCRVGSPDATPQVLIWGDSHALAWLPAFDGLLRDEGLAGLFAGQSACAPLVDVHNPSNARCLAHNASVREILLEDERLRLVVLIASWPSYSWDRGKYRISDASGRTGNSVVFPEALQRTVAMIHGAGRSAWLIGPTPGAPLEAPLRMALARRSGRNDLSGVSTRAFDRKRKDFQRAVALLPPELPLLFTDPGPWFCDAGRCRFESEGLPLYRDGGHLNLRGAAFLRPFLERELPVARERAGLDAALPSARVTSAR